MEPKDKIAIVGIAGAVILQCVAWYMNKNGAITSLVSLLLGGIIGHYFTLKRKTE